MIKCNNCGTEFNEEVKICPECGASDFIYDYIVVGIDADSNGDLEYYQCDDKDISVNDYVKIYGMDKEHLVLDVQHVDPATTTLPIHPTFLAKKVNVENEYNGYYYERKIKFKEGKYQVRYNKDDEFEKKELHKYQNLEIIKRILILLGCIGIFASGVIFLLNIGAMVLFFVMVFIFDTILRYFLMALMATILCFTLAGLCGEQQKINDVKYVVYKIEKLGDKVESFDTWRLNIVYNKQGQIKTLTSKERLFKRRING
ncbi:MAG: hypothetical protein K5923_02010 [Clostridia bacterium]|nr:hypothetical protein [Clostridia bacterium]